MPATRNDNRSGAKALPIESGSLQWLTILAFLTASALIFLLLSEWGRYQIILGTKSNTLSYVDSALILWLLTAKSLACFLPVLPLLALLIAAGYRRAVDVVLIVSWVGIFFFMAGDLIAVSFQGYHLWDYLPYVYDMVRSPSQRIWQWAGNDFGTQTALLMLLLVVAGPVLLVSVGWIVRQAAHRWQGVCQRHVSVVLTAMFLFIHLGMVCPQHSCSDSTVLDRVGAALPWPASVKSFLQAWTLPNTGNAATLVAHQDDANSLGFLSHSVGRKLTRSAMVTANNMGFCVAAVSQPRKESEVAPLVGLASAGVSLRPLEPDRLDLSFEQNPFRSIPWTGAIRQKADSVANPLELVRGEEESLARRLAEDAVSPGPSDDSACVKRPKLPNVILIIFESFRHNVFDAGLMRGLHGWSEQGLRFQRHFSGSNCSHLGLFSLFYSRSPLGYHQTLDRKIPPQFLQIMRRSGYRITFLTSGEIRGFRRVDKFINDESCDAIISMGEFALTASGDWPDSDRRKLAQASSMVNASNGQPQFILFYLVSSHYPYVFPPEFDLSPGSAEPWHFFNPWGLVRNHLSRYANSMRFLDHEVTKMVKSIDPERNIVIVTGDHGESIGEDGVFTHASRMSEIQLRVPFAMVGPGVPIRSVQRATTHMDILPTLLHVLDGKPVPIAHSHGRDLVAVSDPADAAAVVPANGQDWEGVVIVNASKRLAFRTNTNSGDVPRAEFVGTIDEAGQFVTRKERRRGGI